MTRTPVPDVSAVVVIEDVTERLESEAKILHLARHDPLTGLPNRRELRDEIERILCHCVTNRESTIAVTCLDLDGFKQVNDRFGHHAGDEVLVTVADRLRELLRREELVARLGGDEFALVFENATSSGTIALAQRVIRQIARPYRLSTGEAVSISVSVDVGLPAHVEATAHGPTPIFLCATSVAKDGRPPLRCATIFRTHPATPQR